MTTPKELRQQVVEVLLDYYGTNNVHPDDVSDIEDLIGVVTGIIQARDKAHAEEFRRLAAEAKSKELDEKSGLIRRWQEKRVAQTWEQAAQMLEEKLNG